MRRVLILLICFLVPTACGTPAPTTPTTDQTITVFAAASLSEAFGELGAQFERAQGVKVAFNFAGSQQLVQQLSQGAAADVFASASAKEVDSAISVGVVVTGTQHIFARNKLVVIVANESASNIRTLGDLARPDLKLVLAADQVPVGRYAQQTLIRMSADPAFGADFVRNVNANVVSRETNVKAVATKVALGEADAGMVYVTDVTADLRTKMGTLAIPDNLNQIATYPLAPTAKPPAGAELANAFVAYVLSSAGQQVLASYGFLPGGAR